jgi:hypothetical protein
LNFIEIEYLAAKLYGMIQRKQSIWLLLAAVVCMLTLWLPYGVHNEIATDTQTITETALTAKNNPLLLILSVFAAAVSLFSIFQYSQRPKQIRYTLFVLFLNVLMLGDQCYEATRTAIGNKLALGFMGQSIYIGILIPMVSATLLLFAIAGIRSDERLVKDSDRLR